MKNFVTKHMVCTLKKRGKVHNIIMLLLRDDQSGTKDMQISPDWVERRPKCQRGEKPLLNASKEKQRYLEKVNSAAELAMFSKAQNR
jgi:hypothetical protein